MNWSVIRIRSSKYDNSIGNLIRNEKKNLELMMKSGDVKKFNVKLLNFY